MNGGNPVAVIEVKNLVKKFGQFTALNGVTFDVKKGEIFGFIGPNGAGKTTTIQILLGILKATEGEVNVFGLDAWKEAVDIHKRVAFVPGNSNLWPNLTGGEVIDFFLSLRGEIPTERRDQLIERFNLDPTKKCGSYSKGNKQKVALISAFAADADLYILDEPTSGLDPLMEQVFQECVLEAKSQGKSVLLSSHILSEVEKLCDRVGIIKEGKMIEQGTLEDMRHLTRSTVTVQTARPLIELHQLKGVHNIQENKGETSFQLDSEYTSQVMNYLNKQSIQKLISRPATLEDLFLRYYEREETAERGETGNV